MATQAEHEGAIEQARCLGCGYCLYGLDRRCPECGRGFRANDPATFKLATRRFPGSPLGIFVAVVGIAAAYTVFYALLALATGFALMD